jgi:hypothetical protein
MVSFFLKNIVKYKYINDLKSRSPKHRDHLEYYLYQHGDKLARHRRSCCFRDNSQEH